MNVSDLDSFKAILFDLDSTLTHTNHYPIRASELLLQRILKDPSEILEEYVTKLVQNYQQEIRSIVRGAAYKSPFYMIRDATKLALFSMKLEVEDKIIDEGTTVLKNLHIEMSELANGTLEILTRIRNLGIPMGVITNSFEGNAQIILRKLGVSGFFEVIVDGGVVKAFKPMPQPFQFAMTHLGSKPENTLFVGDEFVADIIGGKSIGLTCIWVNNRGLGLDNILAKYGSHFAPDLVVSSLSEVLRFLP
ncbi:MAG: HAD family hydrolase [Candidatus Thorarchaeota archaeon]|nr:HAD family hydrolase [Candidatus Thorarchaeota archaeon]